MSRLLRYLLAPSLLFLFSSCSSLEENVKKELKIPDKITMLFVTQPSCPSCDKLEVTMQQSKPKELLNKYFNLKKVYLGEKLPDGIMEPNGTPTVYFLGSDNEVLVEPMVGEKEEQALMEFLEDALLEFKNVYKVDLVEKIKSQERKEHNETLN
jgi:thiol-disulfide isomerase/thioredoxin